MRTHRTTVAIAAFLAASLAMSGCATKTAEPAPSRPIHARARPTPSPSLSAGSYIGRAASLDLFIIRASDLAQQRSPALRVREVAARLISSQKGTSQQLSFAGRRLDLLPSAVMQASEQARFDRLSAAADFDFSYRREVKAAIEEGLQLNRRYAQAGASPTLRPVAAMAAQAYERDLRLIGYL